MKKILVIGGGGFIGSHIVDKLLAKGNSVRVLERNNNIPYRLFNKNENIEWRYGDFLNETDINDSMVDIDVVYHLVSTTIPKSSNENPIYDVQTNIVGAIQILNSMVKLNVKKIIFISSGGTIYGTPKLLPIDESHSTNPIVSYGVTKLAIEKYLLLYERMYGLRAIILRVSNPYGERQNYKSSQGAVGVFIANALREFPIEIWGNGDIVRDYIYVGDVANAFVSALNYNGAINVFNVSSGFGINLNDLLSVLEKILNKKIKRVYHPSRSYDVPINIISNKLIKSEFDWALSYSFEEAISRTVDWMSMHLSNEN